MHCQPILYVITATLFLFLCPPIPALDTVLLKAQFLSLVIFPLKKKTQIKILFFMNLILLFGRRLNGAYAMFCMNYYLLTVLYVMVKLL